MPLDLDREIDRHGTNSVKWEFLVRQGQATHWDRTRRELGEDRVLPMWVADMDFAAPQAVLDALHARIDHGILGYAAATPDYFESVAGWMQRRHGWSVAPEWIVPAPGIVPALHLIVRRFTAPGDKVLIQRPVYHPFTNAVVNNAREVVANPLIETDGGYRMDLDDLEAKAADPAVKLAILCSPHNPVGRVWTREELRRFGEICARHGVLVVSDEIHHDLVLPGHRFVPWGTLGDDLASRAIVCTAPSKTFNLAGLKTSNLVIPDPELRQEMQAEIRGVGLFGMSPLGIVATKAAYDHGAPWLEQVLAYVAGNVEHVERFVHERIPGLRVVRPEGTYLVWIDCRGLGLASADLDALFMERARIYVDEGHIFGPEGDGFMRLNVACPRSIVDDALERLRRAVAGINAAA
ncbi:MAG: pyridoxal phosphate-dependent aminotransferase [Ectothiorhodospiraceae bacterium]|nr:pyridoxal phosphate-dependent aminotransferase [Ectothiorhodospiraceae bacterium]